MGMFGWLTSDTKQGIRNINCLRGPLPVYLITPNNDKIYEPAYEGYGIFGGKDAYVLLLEWNFPERCTGDFDHDRNLGIAIASRNLVKYPLKFAESPKYNYEDLEPAKDDPEQSCDCSYECWYEEHHDDDGNFIEEAVPEDRIIMHCPICGDKIVVVDQILEDVVREIDDDGIYHDEPIENSQHRLFRRAECVNCDEKWAEEEFYINDDGKFVDLKFRKKE